MGTSLNEEFLRVEHSFMLLAISGVAVHFISKCTALNADMTTFTIFGTMCFAGYFALKAAKEILCSIEEKKMAYEALETKTYIPIRPLAFCAKTEIAKYATSVY